MAAALALARRGHEVTLLEAFAAPRPLGSGLLLQPTGLSALKALGLDQAIRAAGARVDRLQGRDTRGRRVMDLDYGDWRPDAHGVGIHRAVLFDTLHGELAGAGVAVITGARIVRIEDHARPPCTPRTVAPSGPSTWRSSATARLRPCAPPFARMPGRRSIPGARCG